MNKIAKIDYVNQSWRVPREKKPLKKIKKTFNFKKVK